MKLLLIALIFSSLSQAAFALYRPGEVLVRFKKESTVTGRKAFINKASIKSSSSLTTLKAVSSGKKFIKLKLKKGVSVESEVKRLSSDPSVDFVQPNYIYKALATTPNDPEFGQYWALDNVGQTIGNASYSTNNPGITGLDLGMKEAWDIRTDCSSVVVAVIDTGVNYTSLDLIGNMWDGTNCKDDQGNTLNGCIHGYDFVHNANDPMDYFGHGTHVAGTIGASGNNALGGTGICWNVQIMAIKVLGIDGSGTTESIIRGIDFASANGAHVINMSLGGGSDGMDLLFKDAMERAVLSGVFIASAAGNDGLNNDNSTEYPCNFKGNGMVCVAALDQKFQLADFSNYGPSMVELAAPGTNIFSFVHGTSNTIVSDDFTSGWSLEGSWARKELGECWIGSPALLANPPGYCDNSGYSTGINDIAQKDFGNIISGYDSAYFDYRVTIDLDESSYIAIAKSNAATVNFSDAGQIAGAFSGAGTGRLTADLGECSGSDHCSIGAQFVSGSNSSYRGVTFSELVITGVTLRNYAYAVYDGTSMATPHVAGLAALIKAENPNYGPSEIYETLMNSGTTLESLSGKTTTESVINAPEALNYVPVPSGISAQQIN